MSGSENWYSRAVSGWGRLDADQLVVAKHLLYEPESAVCFATAGSGKTFTVVNALAKGLNEGLIKPSDMALVTYTKAGATEMKERLRKIISPEDFASLVRANSVGTIHSVCGRSVKSTDVNWPAMTPKHADTPKHLWAPSRNISIFSSGKEYARAAERDSKYLRPLRAPLDKLISKPQYMLEKFIEPEYLDKRWGFSSVRVNGKQFQLPLDKHHPHISEWPKASDYLGAMQILEAFGHRQEHEGSPERNAMLSTLSRNLPFLEVLWAVMAKIKEVLNVWTFSDQLWAFVQRGERRVKLLVIDEVQDNNWVQWSIVDRLTSEGGRFLATGDSRQAIFTFTGANPNLMIQKEAKRLFMQNNYRSGRRIIEAGSALTYSHDTGEKVQEPWSIGGDARVARRVDPAGLKEYKLADGTKFWHLPPDYQQKEYVAELPGVVRYKGYGGYAFEEATGTAREIRSLIDQGVSPKAMACLGRTHANLADLEIALISERIPCYRRGARLGFFEGADVRAFVAWLGVVQEDSAEALAMVFNTPRRPGIYFMSTKRFLTDTRMGATDAMRSLVSEMPNTAQYAGLHRKSVPAYRDILRDIERIRKMGWPGCVEGVTALLWEQSDVEMDAKVASKNDKMAVIASICGRHETFADFMSFRAEVAFGAPGFSASDMENAIKPIPANAKPQVRNRLLALKKAYEEAREKRVTLLTAHAAKGLEFPLLWVSMTQGVFPSWRSVGTSEEASEKRLAFVAWTRAIDMLTVTSHEMNAQGKPAGPSEYVRDYLEPYINSDAYAGGDPIIPWKRSAEEWSKGVESTKAPGWELPTIDESGLEPAKLVWVGPGGAEVSLEGLAVSSLAHGRQEATSFEGAFQLVRAAYKTSVKLLTAVDAIQDLLEKVSLWEGKTSHGFAWAHLAKELSHRKEEAARLLLGLRAEKQVLSVARASREQVWVSLPPATHAGIVTAPPRKRTKQERKVNTIHDREWRWAQTAGSLDTRKKGLLHLLRVGTCVLLTRRDEGRTSYSVLSVRPPTKSGELANLTVIFELEWDAVGVYNDAAYPALRRAIIAGWGGGQINPDLRTLEEATSRQPFKQKGLHLFQAISTTSHAGEVTSRTFTAKISDQALAGLVTAGDLNLSSKGTYMWP